MSEIAIFATVVQATPPDHLVWRPAWLTIEVSKDCIYLHILKLLLEDLVSNQPETDADEIPPFVTLTSLYKPSKTGPYQV